MLLFAGINVKHSNLWYKIMFRGDAIMAVKVTEVKFAVALN